MFKCHLNYLRLATLKRKTRGSLKPKNFYATIDSHFLLMHSIFGAYLILILNPIKIWIFTVIESRNFLALT
jgi:hypothetical protein